MWYGLNPDAFFLGLLNTSCSANGTCYGKPFRLPYQWVRLFVKKDLMFNLAEMSFKDFNVVFHH
jgi:hypothetical protein